MNDDTWRRLGPAFLVGALLCVVVLRIPSFDLGFWSSDEGFTAAIAGVIGDGGVPYRDGVDHRGPATYLVYLAVYGLADVLGIDGQFALRASLVALLLLLTTGVYLFAARFFDRRVAGQAALLYAVFTAAGPPRDFFAFHTEWVLAAFTLPAAALVLLGIGAERRSRWLSLGAAGLLFGLGFLAKQPAGLDAAAAGFYVTVWWWARRHDGGAIRGWSADAACMLTGFFIPLVATGAYFIFHDALADFYQWYWRYNTETYLGPVSLTDRVAGLFTTDPRILIAGAALVAGAVALRARREVDGFLYVLIWLSCAFAAANLSGRGFAHYHIQFLVPLVLVLSVVLRRASIDERRVDLSLALIVIGSVCLLALEYQPASPPRGSELHFAPHWTDEGFVDAPTITQSQEVMRETVAHIRDNTDEDDRIFVWGGMFSEVYVLSDRRPATRFVYCTFLVGIVPWVVVKSSETADWIVPGSWEQFRADWRAHPPQLIVDTTPSGMHGFAAAYAPQTYELFAPFIDDYVVDRVIELHGRPYLRILRLK